mmetsp:Transcript_70914/g.171584  ORF Transcript_70914/g.171584 Transcript_70914/m.171584 type:complete len:210 (+) Transcript_70914:1297-1926(+)
MLVAPIPLPETPVGRHAVVPCQRVRSAPSDHRDAEDHPGLPRPRQERRACPAHGRSSQRGRDGACQQWAPVPPSALRQAPAQAPQPLHPRGLPGPPLRSWGGPWRCGRWGRGDCTPLHAAAYGGHQSLCTYLAEYTDVNAQTNVGDTALHMAARYGQDSACTYLAELSKIDAQNNDCQTALHLAALSGFSGTVSRLLHARASANTMDVH